MIEIDADVPALADAQVTQSQDGYILRFQGAGTLITLRLHPESADQAHAELARVMAKPCRPRSTAAILARRS